LDKKESKPANEPQVDDVAASVGEVVDSELQVQPIIDNLQKEIQEVRDKHLRLYAEFDNYRKRMQQEKQEYSKYAHSNLLKELLPVLDSFQQAESSFDKDTLQLDDLKKGFALTHKQLEAVLEKYGVQKIPTLKTVFDPHLHEAIAQVPAQEQIDGTIVEEYRAGYQMQDKVLRHSMVVVANNKSTEQ